ncbi:MAG: helix-turn-helix domain-containing protein [Ilumatobacteraceae bacterium]
MSSRHRETALERISELTVVIADAESRQTREVARAVFHGATWAQIGAALGVTAQSAHRRFRRLNYDPSTGTVWREDPLPFT